MINLSYTELLSSNFIFDVTNFFFCAIIVLYICNINNIKKTYTAILITHCLLPFFLNNFIFDINFMPDQVKYAFRINWFRNFYFDNHNSFLFSIGDHPLLNTSDSPYVYIWSKTGFFTWFFSLFPLPNSQTIRFLGFSNKLLFCLLFIYLCKKNILTRETSLIYLFYPSLALYSGLGLREMSSLFFLVIIITQAYNFKPEFKNILFLLFSIFFLYLTKIQYLLIVMPILLILFFNIGLYKVKGFSVLQYFSFCGILICISYSLFVLYGDIINSLRFSFFLDDGNNPESFIEVKSYFYLLYLFCKGVFISLILPIPNSGSSSFEIIQFVENIIILILIVNNSIYCMRHNLKKGLLWFFFLICNLGIIGFIVTNIGTISRYKFTIILIYLIFVNYIYKNEKNKNLPSMCS